MTPDTGNPDAGTEPQSAEPWSTAADYPEDWQEQGWCCRECSLLAWRSLSSELRRELACDAEQVRRNAEYERYAYGDPGIRL